ncbi:TspO/MBR family protein [Sandarakinorhabdus rubra]|uniref:TspO/MBR family protein n=1 Tax=Sandarakinorhabdus rubra TaxID=2672568 RepID=UPI0013DC8452|nr:TspO/MBR family protein [Sandarakinorhabdus rubra]
MTALDSAATELPAPWFSTGSFVRAAIVFVPAILFVGGLMARVAGSTDTNPWYQSLTLPVFQPPPALFGIAWAILYTLIALALAFVWGSRDVPGKGLAIGLFAAGFALNLTWSPLFFRAHMISAALGVLVAMLLVALATAWASWRINRLAGWLMIPYVLWLCFAMAINTSVLVLNPTADAMQMGV